MSQTKDNATQPAKVIKLRPADAALNQELATLEATLSTQEQSLRELLRVAQEKLDALRNAQRDTLHDLTRIESELLSEVARQDQARRAAFAPVAQRLQLPGGAKASLRSLAQRLDEPQRSQWVAFRERMNGLASKLQERNALVGRVARDLHSHLRGVFSDLARSQQQTVGYSDRGTEARANRGSAIVDAVG